MVISNKQRIEPHEWKPEPEYTLAGWHRGYSFKHFWSCCFFLLGDDALIDGMQQLCHHYYLQNGGIGAVTTVARIRKFVGLA